MPDDRSDTHCNADRRPTATYTNAERRAIFARQQALWQMSGAGPQRLVDAQQDVKVLLKGIGQGNLHMGSLITLGTELMAMIPDPPQHVGCGMDPNAVNPVEDAKKCHACTILDLKDRFTRFAMEAKRFMEG